MAEDLDEFGRSDLHYAANEGAVEAVRLLLSVEYDPNLPDAKGWTPLHFAAQAGSAEVTRLLLDAGADVDARDSYGNTPLVRAVFNSRGDGEVIQMLRNSGSDPHQLNHSRVSPLKLARTISNFDVARFFADIDEPDGHGN